MSEAQPSGTVTLVFTDVEGSTKLLEELRPEPCYEIDVRSLLAASFRHVRRLVGHRTGPNRPKRVLSGEARTGHAS